MAKGSRKPDLSPEDFYLDDTKLNEGVRLPLRGRDRRLTKEWIQVRSVHSDVYQAAVAAALRQAYTDNPDAELPVTEREIFKAYRHLLVSDWSFAHRPEPAEGEDGPRPIAFTVEAVKTLLDRNPSIAGAVAEVATNSSLFFTVTGEPSSPGPSES